MTKGAVRQMLDGIDDPALSVDEFGLVSAWNAAATRLLGHEPGDVLARPCHEVLRGRDVFGNCFCQPHCPLLLSARQRDAVRHFQLDVYSKWGTAISALCFVVVVPGVETGALSIVHLLRPVDAPLLASRSSPEPNGTPMTPRELDVLRLLAEGATTHDITAALHVSTSTVRKHVQNLLRKLRVTTRLAAVLTAMERRLL
jgi:DNA-binding CsgD family transcriptional regulator